MLESLPLTVNGKVDRAALVARAEPGAAPVAVRQGGRGIDQLVIDLWCRALGLDEVCANENLFDLGATSLTVAVVRNALVAQLGRQIPITLLYEEPTPARLSAALSGIATPSAVYGPVTGPPNHRRPEPPAARAARRATRRAGRAT